MKKTLLSLVAFAAISTGAYAQTPDVHFGFKGGYNLSTFGGDVDDAKSLSGFHLGGFVEIPVSAKFAIQPEVLYSAQGAKFKESFMGFTLESKTKLDYINIPILAKYYVTDAFSVEAGPQIGFNVKAENDYDGSTTDIKDGVKSIDFALALGVAYRLNSGLFFSGRYNFGMSNVDDASGSDDYKVKNNVLQISVGYRF